GSRRQKPEPITIADVFQVFPGARIVPADQPKTCPDCGDSPHAKIVPCKWPDREILICHECGRELDGKSVRVSAIKRDCVHPLMKLVGKRGGVFCRKCHRPMMVSIVNGGYDWNCEPCGIVWRYRPMIHVH